MPRRESSTRSTCTLIDRDRQCEARADSQVRASHFAFCMALLHKTSFLCEEHPRTDSSPLATERTSWSRRQNTRHRAKNKRSRTGKSRTKPWFAGAISSCGSKVAGPITQFSGDGAYDTGKSYDTLNDKKIEPVIPPQQNAVIEQHGNSSEPRLPRDEAIRTIKKTSRKSW